MRIQKKDLPWIIPLSISVLIFFNIIVQENIHKFRGFKNAEFNRYVELNKALFSLPVPQSLSEEDMSAYLPFELHGTIIGNRSLALIYNSDTEKNGLYGLNDLVGDYTLAIIAPGKVLLEKGGIKQELLLAAGNGENADSDSEIDTGGAIATVLSMPHLFAQLPKVNELLAKIKILPVPQADSPKLKGFRIDNVPPGSIIDEIGIKSGDVICSVEGKELQSIQDAWDVFNTVKKQSLFEVVLLRHNKPLTLKYQIKN
ncbi:MAG: hypothetical protein A3K83_04150 [Omnitrophica WOR_2 bacterium RBG_13_44_8b]|nr:MAG: hypothetical protein A3K83_04150 [Omnitrophica WOR_2 bacterium RBG_13_44_8b]